MAVTEITNATHGCRETIDARVKIPADLSHTGEARWDWKPIDKCLWGLVVALQHRGAYTRACCCGHGKAPGNVMLWDGTVITTDVCPLFK